MVSRLDPPQPLGLEEQVFGGGVCVIEWAARATGIFPEGCLWIDLGYGPDPDRRDITLEPGLAVEKSRFRSLLGSLAKKTATSNEAPLS